MIKKLAKIKYLPNNFQVIEPGDYVICAVSGKSISLENLNYWNVDLQEPYYSYVEASKKKEEIEKSIAENIPMKRVGEAEDLAGLITFLASEKANYMTGLAIQVDGGSARTFY